MKGVGVLDIICARRDFLNNGIYVRFNVTLMDRLNEAIVCQGI